MDRTKTEALATFLATVALGLLAWLGILASADGIFTWDILPPLLDKVAVLVIVSLCIILGASVLLSIMLNISIIARRLSAIASGQIGRNDERD